MYDNNSLGDRFKASREPKPSYRDFFMAIAFLAGSRTKDNKYQVIILVYVVQQSESNKAKFLSLERGQKNTRSKFNCKFS